jgi:hypothetical protein
VTNSRYYIWAIYDVEAWSKKPAVNGARVQDALRRIELRAFRRAGIDQAAVERQPTGDGAVLAIPGDTSKELLTTKFIDGLREGIEEHDASCPPEESIRLRLGFHAGDGLAGDGEWAGPGVILASRLVNSAVLRRVLKAATGHALAFIISDDWYQAIIRQGLAPADGYQQVLVREREKDFSSLAWIRVPGRDSPPGLLPEDRPESGPATGTDGGPDPRPYISAPAGTVNNFHQATIHGGVSIGNQYHGTGSRDGEPR